jgi:hypothetical protein
MEDLNSKAVAAAAVGMEDGDGDGRTVAIKEAKDGEGGRAVDAFGFNIFGTGKASSGQGRHLT